MTEVELRPMFLYRIHSHHHPHSLVVLLTEDLPEAAAWLVERYGGEPLLIDPVVAEQPPAAHVSDKKRDQWLDRHE